MTLTSYHSKITQMAHGGMQQKSKKNKKEKKKKKKSKKMYPKILIEV